MTVTIKNPSLHKKIFKKIDKYDSKAIKCYEKGNMKGGRRFEKISDNLYKNNYRKMFKITRKN